jgi:hypothetical protein
MAKSEGEKLTEEKIASGGVLVKFYFDMQSPDKEKLQPLLADLINQRLMREKGVVYCFGSIDEPIEHKGIYTSNAIVTVLFDNFFSLISIAFNYAPAGIEILKPTGEMRFKMSELQSLLMELVGISVTYSKFVLDHVLKPEDKENLQKQLEAREALGRKLLDTKKTAEESKKTK